MNKTYIKKYREFINNIGNNKKQDEQMLNRVKIAYEYAFATGMTDSMEDFLKYLYNNPGKETEIILKSNIENIEKEIELIKS